MMADAQTQNTTEDRVVASLALVSGYRMLIGLETLASVHGAATHVFPPHALTVDGAFWSRPDRLTVAALAEGYEYLWVDGPVGRDTAARILATDKGAGL